jgi:heme-degrading monooxygenase HmoA
VLAKWITCDVPARTRERFAADQQRWSVIADQPGLIGQVGGWDSRTGRAHVLGLWADAGSHQAFLRDRHDAVADTGGHTGIAVALGEVVLTMSGATTVVAGAMSGGLLRVADCHLVAGAEEHFVAVQREVWAPAMAAAGVLGGVLARPAARRYLVATFWPDVETHRRYAEDVPRVRAQAAVDLDIASMSGHVLALEPTWRVFPIYEAIAVTLGEDRGRSVP